MTHTDAELLRECREGSLAAFERLYALHGERMKSLARNLTGNAADAEDAVQDAFVKIFRGIASFKEESLLSTWIYRVVVNAAYDLMRRRRRRLEIPEEDLQERPDPHGGPVDHPSRLSLERCVAHLDPRLRDVFLLFEVEGFKHREIAQILSISEGTSKYLLFESKRELKRLLAPPPAQAVEGRP